MSHRRQAAVAAVSAAIVIASTVLLARGTSPTGATQLRGTAGRHSIEVEVAAVVVGVTAVDIVVRPVGAVEIRVEPTMTDMGHAYPPITAILVDEETGRYRAEVRFDMSGRWELTVVVDDGTDTARVGLPLTVTR
jgi:hypothetical protein